MERFGSGHRGAAAGKQSYLVETVQRACDLLEAFRFDGEQLRLRDLVSRTGLNKATAFRILSTLEHRGLIERVGGHSCRSIIKTLKRPKYRLGYAAQTTEFSFSRDVTESILRVAAEERVDLIVLDNRFSPTIALRNADLLIKQRVDLVIEFQTDEHVAPIISSKFFEAGIPMIAIEIPHPGATYYGANNYQAGLIGGRHLGRWAKTHWQGRVDEVLLLDLPKAGAVPASRLTGTLAGIREILPSLEDFRIVRLNGDGRFAASLEAVRKHLRRSRAEHTLIGAINDPSTLGALNAFEETGHHTHCAAMGQNASTEARAELRRPDTRLLGSVDYFPETYGEGVIQLALGILNKRPVPPAIFVKHRLITPDNIDQLYPNDRLLGPASNADNLLLSRQRA
jgi:ribose transport system substrate-binding protein